MSAERAETLARGGLDWILARARETDVGISWTVHPGVEEVNSTFYHGASGIVPALLEAWRHFGEDRFADAALRAARSIEATLEELPDSSLYLGRAGAAVALNAVARGLDDAQAAAGAKRALDLIRGDYDGECWGDAYELMLGNAGIGLAALDCGDADLAVAAVEPYSTTTETTPNGVTWEHRRGIDYRLYNFGHGSLGIVYALAVIAEATGREDLLAPALAGAAEVVSHNEDGPEGFLAPHSDPPRDGPRHNRYGYGWCAGPTGDAVAFRALARVTGDPKWTELVDRCWHTVSTSGLPERLRPGFWDNSAHCCGTAGVLGFAGDMMVERGTGGDFAEILVADLDARATVEGDLICWSNHEHRDSPPDLPPRVTWSMGAAGIVRELLRYARLAAGGDHAYAQVLPEELAAQAPDRRRIRP